MLGGLKAVMFEGSKDFVASRLSGLLASQQLRHKVLSRAERTVQKKSIFSRWRGCSPVGDSYLLCFFSFLYIEHQRYKQRENCVGSANHARR